MKYIKTYESIFKNLFKGKLEPKVGDFIIADTTDIVKPELKKFMENNIGKIIKINKKSFKTNLENITSYTIFYSNPPSNLLGGWCYHTYMKSYQHKKRLNGGIYPLVRDQIKYFSKNKEDLEQILNANKYNL